MTTQAAMIDEIQSDTERTSSDDETAIRNKIGAAIRAYQKRRFWFNESRDVTFSTVASTVSYGFSTIGTEFYRLDGVFLTYDGEVLELDRADYTALEAADTQQGVPSHYAYVNRALRLWQAPDDAYSVRLTGHIKLAAPASDAEADNAWMTEAYDLIMAHAKAELYAHRWEDERNAAIQQTIVREKLRDLTFATHDKVEPGYLEATEF
jgi:hypothetical protein